MIEKPLDQIGEADLQALVGRAEGRRLEYKQELPGNGHEPSKKFLHEVTSLANSDGGDLIIGIRDEDATAAEVVGLPVEGLNEAITGLENKIRDGVEPRLPSVHAQTVPIANGRAVIIFRIGASLIAPHRVKLSDRFYGRNSLGKYPLDVGELRLAFAATDKMPEMMRDLHTKAVAAAAGADMPTQVVDAPIAVVTIAPLTVIREMRDMEITEEQAVLPVQPSQHHLNYRFVVSLGGLIVYPEPGPDDQGVNAWAVNHRRGYVDFAWRIDFTNLDDQTFVLPGHFSNGLVGAANSAVARLREHGFEGPWTAMASLRGVAGFRAAISNHALASAAWQNAPFLGEVVGENLNEATLMPLIRAFWRVFGQAEPVNVEQHN